MRKNGVLSNARHNHDQYEPELQWLEDAVNMVIGYTVYCVKAACKTLWLLFVKRRQ
jgi:hypothetical protein